jgi:hypothetical protein
MSIEENYPTEDSRVPEPEWSIEERLARLEGKLGWRDHNIFLKQPYFFSSLAILLLAVVLGVFGLGLPNHYYQIVLAGLTVALAYHQGWFAKPGKPLHWVLSVLDTLTIAILFKLVIGSGSRFPFFWVLYPSIERAKDAPEGASWKDVVPNYSLNWQDSALAQWSVDLTIVQSFLLILTLAGALIEFQPFASLTALLLIVVSIPALVGFDWTLIFPTLILAFVAFYLQSADANE